MQKNNLSNTDLDAARRLEQRTLESVRAGQMKEAIASCRQLNSRYPGLASGWYTASQLAGKLGNHRGAVEAIERAIELEPGNSKWQLQKAASLMRAGHPEQARPLLLQLDKIQLGSGFQCSLLALQLSRLELHERALHHYQRAIRLEPKVGEHHYNIASVHRFLGNFEAAERSLDRAIELNPGDFEAYKLRSDLRTQTPERNNVVSLEAALSHRPSATGSEVYLNFALAKELEDLGEWHRSFSHLEAGAKARRKRMRYDIQGDIDTMAQIANSYSADRLGETSGGDDNNEAIFVLGMPRTGTTLVERIIASHSEVTSAGELNNFALQMSGATRRLLPPDSASRKLSKLELVKLSTGLGFARLGSDYIKSTRPLSGRTPRFIDKMPLNFLYIGLIRQALPNAKLVHLTRHPLDTCYAIYKNLFSDAYPFSYSLEETGRYYAAYRRLMGHWHTALPGCIYDQSYEALVSNLNKECVDLLRYCGLPWEDACLNFHKNAQASTTASATQVRQQVYSTSINKWHHYRDELAPLIRTLEKEGVDPELD